MAESIDRAPAKPSQRKDVFKCLRKHPMRSGLSPLLMRKVTLV